MLILCDYVRLGRYAIGARGLSAHLRSTGIELVVVAING